MNANGLARLLPALLMISALGACANEGASGGTLPLVLDGTDQVVGVYTVESGAVWLAPEVLDAWATEGELRLRWDGGEAVGLSGSQIEASLPVASQLVVERAGGEPLAVLVIEPALEVPGASADSDVGANTQALGGTGMGCCNGDRGCARDYQGCLRNCGGAIPCSTYRAMRCAKAVCDAQIADVDGSSSGGATPIEEVNEVN